MLLVEYTQSVLGSRAAAVSEITMSFGLKILFSSRRQFWIVDEWDIGDEDAISTPYGMSVSSIYWTWSPKTPFLITMEQPQMGQIPSFIGKGMG